MTVLTWRENTSPRPHCPRPRGRAGGSWGSTPGPQSPHPDTLCHDPDQHHPMMNLCQTGTPQKARKDSSCKIRKLTLKIFSTLICFVFFHKEILTATPQFLSLPGFTEDPPELPLLPPPCFPSCGLKETCRAAVAAAPLQERNERNLPAAASQAPH